MSKSTSADAADARAVSRARKVAAVLTLFAGLFLLASLLSFDRADPPSTAAYPANDPPQNRCGVVGAHVAYALLWAVGDGVAPLLLFLVGAAFLWLSQRGVEDKVFRILGAILLVLAVSLVSSMITVPALLPVGNGGVLGLAIWQFAEPRLGTLGTVLLVVPVALVGLVLLTDINLFAVPLWVYRRFRGAMHVPVRRLATAAVAGAGAATAAFAEPEVKPVVRKQKRPKKPELEEDEPPADGTEEAEDEEAAAPAAPSAKPREIVIRHTRPEPAEGADGEQQEFAFTPLPTTPRNTEYKLPGVDLLDEPDYVEDEGRDQRVRSKADVLTETLDQFGVKARVVAIETGPVITQYELALAPGVKVSKVVGLSDDLAISLKAPSVRVVAPLPGKNTIGVEVPNTARQIVSLREIVLGGKGNAGRMGLPLFLGKDATGEALVKDLASMPHLLIAGTTGSGKSVCLNAIIMSMLLTRTPDDLKLVLIDPKMVELSVYNKLPHLLCPVVNDMRKAEAILEWLVDKMEERYRLLSTARVRNIAQYNRLPREDIVKRFEPANEEQEARLIYHMPHIAVIVDELADLMMVAAKEVEGHVTRLSQKSRAVGIHLVMATQRPSVDVLTGLIKSNLPVRVSFQVASRIDSRTILDSMGADKLLGQGDMLFMTPGASKFIRAQGAFVSEIEIQRVLDFVTEEAEPAFQRELVQLKVEDEDAGGADDVLAHGCDDEMYEPAIEIVLEAQRGSVSLLQRRLGIGYGRAARLIDQMAEDGIVGDYKGSQAREVVLTLEQWEAMKGQRGTEAGEYTAPTYGDDEDDPEPLDEDDLLTDEEAALET